MFSECLSHSVRSHLRCHVDFQAVKKTQPGPTDPRVEQIYGSLREKKLLKLNSAYVFSLESYNHP